MQRMTRQEENRQDRNYLFVLGSIAAIATLILLLTPQHSAAEEPDWTVPSCALYAHGAQPELPPYTRQDVCVNPDGTLSVP